MVKEYIQVLGEVEVEGSTLMVITYQVGAFNVILFLQRFGSLMFESLDKKENSSYETSSGDSDSGIGYGYGGGNYDRNGGAGIASLFTGSGVV